MSSELLEKDQRIAQLEETSKRSAVELQLASEEIILQRRDMEELKSEFELLISRDNGIVHATCFDRKEAELKIIRILNNEIDAHI